MTKGDTFRLRALHKNKHRLNVRIREGLSRPGLNPDCKHYTPCFVLPDELSLLASRESRYLENHAQKLAEQLGSG